MRKEGEETRGDVQRKLLFVGGNQLVLWNGIHLGAEVSLARGFQTGNTCV
jgi:hypothetical protein